MIIQSNGFSRVGCWSSYLSKSLSWSNPRYLSIFLSRVRCESFDRYWSSSWLDYGSCSTCWSENI